MALIDPRIKKQAQVLVEYSLNVKKGENVLIVSDFVGRPLVTELYRLLIRRGAGEIKLHFDSSELHEIYYKNSTPAQRKLFPQISYDEVKKIDCWIGIICTTNTRGLTGVDASIISQQAKIVKSITDWRVEKTRWVLTEFPSSAKAQEADMSFSDYEDFVFSAINKVNWEKKFKEQEKLRKLVDRVKEVHIVGTGTDLRLGIAGRKAENAGGTYNMP
ncbi:MAG: aminopeptidase, partial [Patescibacteria group bacterium]